jgi:hypothetical protein
MRKLRLVSKKTLFDRADQLQKHVKMAFFHHVRNALVTSIHGTEAEASRMSGGDYDGDRAWISWNKDLLKCLPDMQQFVEEDTSAIKNTVSDVENKLWSKCCETDILRYMNHYRNHQQMLGRLSELLDVYIDSFGFADERTKEIGRATFLQVRDFTMFPFISLLISKRCFSG